MDRKLKKVEKCKHVIEEERVTVQGMLKDINKCFNNDDNCYKNQQLNGCRDLFRGVIVKEWVIGNYNTINFYTYNKH